jgi:hypothetical protein
MALEKMTNPFLRCDSATIQHAACQFNLHAVNSPEATFCAIRKMKNLY